MEKNILKHINIGIITALAALCITGCNKSVESVEPSESDVLLITESTTDTTEQVSSAGQDDAAMEKEFNADITAFVAEQQELYTDRKYLSQSVSVSGTDDAGLLTEYHFTGDDIELILKNGREIYCQYTLRHDGRELCFDGDGWDNQMSPDYVDAYLYDMTGDGQDELVVVYTRRTMSTQDEGTQIKVIDLETMSVLDTDGNSAQVPDNELFAENIKEHVQARSDREELDKKISVRINGLNEKYAGEKNVKAYIYVKDDEDDNVYIAVTKDGQLLEAFCIKDASGSGRVSYMDGESAQDILKNDAYKQVGVRLIAVE